MPKALCIRMICMLLLLACALWLRAEEASAPEAQPSQVPTEATAQPANKPPENSETPDTFVPSEDISEDLSVSYPVDI